MNTRYRTATRRSTAAAATAATAPANANSSSTPSGQQPHHNPPQRGRFRIVIVETTTNNAVDLCSVCTHRVNELQHDNAAFALKSEYEELKNEEADEFNNEEEVVDVNAIDDSALTHGSGGTDAASHSTSATTKKERSTRSSKPRPKRRFGYDEMMKNSTTAGGPDTKYHASQQPKKAIFPESEYDVLEKKLIELESQLASAKDEEFKKLCKIGVLCEERWAELYCRDYGKPLEECRNQAISVLKHNLDIRRGDSVRPRASAAALLNGGGEGGAAATPGTMRVSRRDPMTVNPSVSIASGQFLGNNAAAAAAPARDSYRGGVGSKRNFGTCIPIRTLATGPINNYSYIQDDQCFMIENILFDVESRLKRVEPNSKEYHELIDEGRKLREEWRQAREEMLHGKPSLSHHHDSGFDITKQPGYDITKCVVLGRTRRQRTNDDFVDIE